MLRQFAAFFFLSLALTGYAQVSKVGGSGVSKIGGAGVSKIGAGATTPVIVNAWKNGAAATSVAVTVAPTTGNALVVFVGGYSGAVANLSVSDNIDGTTGWTANLIRSPDTSTAKAAMFTKFNIPAGVVTVTCTSGAGASRAYGIVHELTGVTAFTPGESNGSASGGTNNPQTGTATNATASSIYFAGMAQDLTTQTINGTGTTGTWNLYSANSSDNVGSPNLSASVPNIVVSSGAARGHGWTLSGFPNSACVVMVVH